MAFSFLFIFSWSLAIYDKNQARKVLQNLSEKTAEINYGDPLLSVFDLAEEWSNQPEFWKKTQEQEGWISWLEERYFKEKLTGFEVVDFKDSISKEIKVEMKEGYKTQIYQLLIPKNDSIGVWISLERKSTPALLFEESQQMGLPIPDGITLGIYVDGMLQQVRGKAILSPFWKENLNEFAEDGEFIYQVSTNGKRQTISAFPFRLELVIWSKTIWFLMMGLFSYGFSNFTNFILRWKTEKRFKIQWVVLGMVLLSSLIFSAYSIRISKQQYHDEILRNKLLEVEKFSAQLREILINSNINNPTTQIRLNRLSRIWEVDFRLVDLQHQPLFQTFYFDQPMEFLESKNLHENWYSLKKQDIRSIQYLIQLPEKNLFFEWFLFNEDSSQSMENSGKMIHILATIILLLFLISWRVGKWLIEPFITLKEQLILTGDTTLVWPDQDEIGQLVHAYNSVLMKVKKQAETLAEQEKERAWKNMARQVAHEIRNPLTPMKLQLQLLVRMPEGEKKQEQLKKTISVLHEQMNSLERISSEFSSFANFPEPQIEKQDLAKIVQNAINLYSSEAQITFDFPPPIQVPIDGEMIMRAIGNLIKNAVQAYGDSHLEKKIHLRLFQNSKSLELDVEDWAGGIPEDLQSQIFQPNFTTKSSGMGLGLSLILRTMESHHGSVQLKVKPHEGCIFTLRFPLHVG